MKFASFLYRPLKHEYATSSHVSTRFIVFNMFLTRLVVEPLASRNQVLILKFCVLAMVDLFVLQEGENFSNLAATI